MKTLALIFAIILLFAGVCGVVSKVIPDIESEATDLEETKRWILFETIDETDQAFSDDACERLSRGGKFKVVAYHDGESSDDLAVTGTVSLNYSNGTTKDVQLFYFNCDADCGTHSRIFETTARVGESYSNFAVTGAHFTVELYIYDVLKEESGSVESNFTESESESSWVKVYVGEYGPQNEMTIDSHEVPSELVAALTDGGKFKAIFYDIGSNNSFNLKCNLNGSETDIISCDYLLYDQGPQEEIFEFHPGSDDVLSDFSITETGIVECEIYVWSE